MDKSVIRVVAGILRDSDGRVLLTQRPPGKHLAGLWEFPGGKLEIGESPQHALRRELHEEIGVEVEALRRVIGFPWDYAEKSIFLDVYEATKFSGVPRGREGQAVRWEFPDDLRHVEMPAADVPIVSALRLPNRYAITPEPSEDTGGFLEKLENVLRAGIKLVQLRSKHMPPDALTTLAAQALATTRHQGARLILNGNVDVVTRLRLDGIHLSTAELMRCSQRPVDRSFIVGTSCHNAAELDHAVRIGVDFAVLGPVMPTNSHPNAQPLGWSNFSDLCMSLPLPIYALGGMRAADLPKALDARAQGIAGISAFWN